MSRYVLDAGPIIDLLRGQPEGKFVADLLTQTENSVYVHALNWMEVFYDASRESDVLQARTFLAALEEDGLIRSELLDTQFCEDAAQLKADWKKVSLADCCGVALARRVGAQLVTTDRHELENLSAAGVADIIFTR
ncbi:MAG: PIN domain-containing protein [Armatimonadetes bacterium]|nr:PIN domain-containing protein [Armatimonadota bacterium]